MNPGSNPSLPPDTPHLSEWMRKVLTLSRKAENQMTEPVVHELRTALRRCRTLADGFMELDPEPAWRKMRKSGKNLFKHLGLLRDIHILQKWAKILIPPRIPLRTQVLRYLTMKEREHREFAHTGLKKFDHDQWSYWIHTLNHRSNMLPLGHPSFELMALKRYEEAHQLHAYALKDRTPLAWHRLRIGIKRFRYIVENFLPLYHTNWGNDLKAIQDLLGEVHDLDVFEDALLFFNGSNELKANDVWRVRLQQERKHRLDEYYLKMSGRNSLWGKWRDGLPKGEKLAEASLEQIQSMALFRDSEFHKTRETAQLACDLMKKLQITNHGNIFPSSNRNIQRILIAGSYLSHLNDNDYRKSAGKESRRLLACLKPLPGWSDEEFDCLGWVVRYLYGPPPTLEKLGLKGVSRPRRSILMGIICLIRFIRSVTHQSQNPIKEVKVIQDLNEIKIDFGEFEFIKINKKVRKEAQLLSSWLNCPIRLMISGMEEQPVSSNMVNRTP